MEQDDLQILRYAALELQTNSEDIIRVAGVVQRVKDWWKTRRDKKNLKALKAPVENIFKRLDEAVRGQDMAAVERITSYELPALMSETVQKADVLRDTMLSHTAPERRNSRGEPIAGEDHRWVSKNYKEDRGLVEELWDKLPEEFRKEIPIGRYIGQPITNFSWYNSYQAQDIDISPTVQSRTQTELMSKLSESGINTDYADWDKFFDDLKQAILSNSSILDRVIFASPSKQVEKRIANEMHIDVIPPEVFLSIGDKQVPIKINHILLTDLGTRVHTKIHKLSVMGIYLAARSRHYKMPAAVPVNIPVEESEDIKQASDGAITTIIKRALLRKALPRTQAIVKVIGLDFPYKVQFARVLASALRQEIDAECSVRHSNNDIEIQTDVYGSKMAALPAIFGIAKYVSDQFLTLTKVGVDIEVIPGISTLEVISSDVLDRSFRRVALGCWRGR
jgi:hypothetical protein